MGGGGSTDVKDTEDRKELARIASEQFKDYQERYVPAENIAIRQGLDRERIARRLRGETSADFYQRFGEGQQKVLGAEGQKGTGLRASTLAGYQTDRAYAAGQGAAGVEGLATQERLAKAQQLVALGQGQASEASGGIAESAAASQRQAIMDARAAAAARGATRQLVGTGIGLGAGYYADSVTPKTDVTTGGLYDTSSSNYSFSSPRVLTNQPVFGGG